MNFNDLHEGLRVELGRRIERGTLTGTELARQTGFKQAHISNFLNGRRALSLTGLDRVLAAQGLSIDQMMPVDLSAAAARAAPEVEAVPVVSGTTAMEDAVIRPEGVIETVQVAASALRGIRWWAPDKYAEWLRYVAVRADAQEAAAMDPLIVPGAVVVLDRHYHSLAPYSAGRRTLYGVRAGGGLALRYVEFDGENLILRPLAQEVPVQVVVPGAKETPADYIVGRVCVVMSEL
ncbi:MAG: helix-turn-helix domain-containing protein [Acidobacteriota bacterium]|nr:helix-turn-helix domain-containing protein [Acidobacteriota bacterium]